MVPLITQSTETDMESGVEHLKRVSMSTTCSVILGKGRFLQEMVEVTFLWCKTQSYAEGGKLEAVLTFVGMDGTKDGTMANTMVWAINELLKAPTLTWIPVPRNPRGSQ